VEEIGNALPNGKDKESKILVRYFNAHVGKDKSNKENFSLIVWIKFKQSNCYQIHQLRTTSGSGRLINL